MRKICYCVAMSLDGYIAGPNGEYDWITMDPEIDFAAMMQRFDALIMGRKTLEMTRAMHGAGGVGMPGIRSYVVSTTLKQDDYPDVKIINTMLLEELNAIRREPGKDIWLFGGGILFKSLLAIRQVQSVEVAIVPVLLGGGIPLLPAPASRHQLKCVKSRTYQKSGIQAIEYQVI